MGLKKLIKKFKQLQIEGIELSAFPEETQELFGDLVKYADEENFVSQASRKERKMAELQ